MNPALIAKLIAEDIHTDNGMAQSRNAFQITEAKIPIPQRKLGKLPVKVGIYSLGGESTISKGEEEDALEIINKALDLGINYIDTAPLYGDTISEERIGKVGRRKEFYLATKTDKRAFNTAWRQINESVERLGAPPDCIQIHHLDHMYEVEQVFDKNGVLKALLKARDQKLCKYIGITGHSDPTPLLEALSRYDFDTVLGAINIADPYAYSFQNRLIPYCLEKNIGFIAMKVCSRGKIFNAGVTMKNCLDYVWSIPGVSTAIIGITTTEQLEHNIRLSKKFKKLDSEQMQELEKQVEEHAEDILFFRKHHKWINTQLPDEVY